MERREMLTLGGLAAIAGAVAATTENAGAAEKSVLGKKVIRIYTDKNGDSKIEELEIATRPGETSRRAPALPASEMIYAEYIKSTVEDWHVAPARQFSISMSGEIEVEVSGGVKHAIHAGDMVFLEDLTGQGHITRLLSQVTNVFIRVPDSFDVVAWTRGEA